VMRTQRMKIATTEGCYNKTEEQLLKVAVALLVEVFVADLINCR